MHSTSRPKPATPPLTVAVRAVQWERRMRAAGLATRADQGRALGVDRTTVGRLVAGRVTPSASIIAAALALLDVPFEELFEIVPTSPSPRRRRREVAA